MTGGGLFRVSSYELGLAMRIWPSTVLDGLSSMSLVPCDFIVNAIDDNVPFILCFDSSTSGG